MKSYAIADHQPGGDESVLLARIEHLAGLGVEMIQLRAKRLDDRDLFGLARRCRSRIGQGSRFILNGRADIAVAAAADGVHLPSDGVPVRIVRSVGSDLLVGRSCHTLAEVDAAEGDGVDFVVFGPVHEARSSAKPGDVSRRDLEAAGHSSLDVYALGGFDLDRSLELRGTGIAGVAAITMFMSDEPIEEIVETIREAVT